MEKYAYVIFRDYKKNARRRGFFFELTKTDFLRFIEGDCFYCGSPPNRRKFSSSNNIFYNGIDRLDSKKDYTMDNCVPCCFRCNRMKNEFALDFFIQAVKDIYEFKILKKTKTILD